MSPYDIQPGQRIRIHILTGVEYVTVTAVDTARRIVDYRADDGFEHWTVFDNII